MKHSLAGVVSVENMILQAVSGIRCLWLKVSLFSRSPIEYENSEPFKQYIGRNWRFLLKIGTYAKQRNHALCGLYVCVLERQSISSSALSQVSQSDTSSPTSDIE